MQVSSPGNSPFNVYLISKIDEHMTLFPRPVVAEVAVEADPVEVDPAAAPQPAQAPQAAAAQQPAPAPAPAPVRPIDFAQAVLLGHPILALQIATNSVANLFPRVVVVQPVVQPGVQPAVQPAAPPQAGQAQVRRIPTALIKQRLLQKFPPEVIARVKAQDDDTFERMRHLPGDVQRLIIGQLKFSDWIMARSRTKPAVVEMLDRQVMMSNKIENRFERFLRISQDEKLFGFFFDQFVEKATPAELIALLNKEDQFRSKAYALSAWAKTITTMRDFLKTPYARFPLVILCGVVAYKVAKVAVEILQKIVVPLIYAVGETFLPRRVFRAANYLLDNMFNLYLLGRVIEYFSRYLPAPVAPHVHRVGSILCFPDRIAIDIGWYTLTLPIAAFGYAVGSIYTNAALIDQVLRKGVDATQAARLREGLPLARRRWIENMSNFRRPLDAPIRA